MIKLFVNLFFLAISILLLEDSTNKTVYIDVKHSNFLINNKNSFRFFDYPKHLTHSKNSTFQYSINNNIVKCNIIKKYKNLNINTPSNIVLLRCNTKSYINIIKCSENNCKYKITPYITYRCFPNYLCDIKLFNQISGILYR